MPVRYCGATHMRNDGGVCARHAYIGLGCTPQAQSAPTACRIQMWEVSWEAVVGLLGQDTCRSALVPGELYGAVVCVQQNITTCPTCVRCVAVAVSVVHDTTHVM